MASPGEWRATSRASSPRRAARNPATSSTNWCPAVTRRSSQLAAAAVSFLIAGSAFAQFGKNKIVYGNFDWHVYTSPHFEVHYCPEEEEFLQRVVSDAESAYLKLSRFLDHEIKFKIPLIYYRTNGDFEDTKIQ